MDEFVKAIIFAVLRMVGAAIVRGHVDEWEAAELAADTNAARRLGPRP